MSREHRMPRPGGRGRGRGRAGSWDDGTDVDRYFGREGSRRNHKVQQLCRQVYRILALELPAADPLLGDMQIERVDPAPDAGRLAVVLRPAPTADPAPLSRILQHIEQAKPALRQAVAVGIVRKRAPELIFIVTGA